MFRRVFTSRLVIGFFPLTIYRNSYAWLPLLGWMGRVVVALLERQAATGLIRIGAGGIVRATSRNVLRSSASSGMVAIRASKAAVVLKGLTVTAISAVALDEVWAHVQGKPDDSLLRWTLAYFAVLTQSDAEAAMGMWVDPPHEKHFNHLNQGARFRVTQLVQETRSHVLVSVVGKNRNEDSKNYAVRLAWTQTDLGPRVSDMETVG